MKKMLSFLLILVCIVAFSTACNKNNDDIIIGDVDFEDFAEKEVSNNLVKNDLDKVLSGEDSVENNGVLNTENPTDEGEIEKEAENQPFSDANKENVENANTNEIDVKLETITNSYNTLSNKTNAWGFVRKPEGTQPEFYGPYTKILNDYEGIYVGNKDKKVIYLTFDEGYENGYTATILDTLKEKGVTAVFFVTLPYVKQNPDLIQRMIDENQIIR